MVNQLGKYAFMNKGHDDSVKSSHIIKPEQKSEIMRY